MFVCRRNAENGGDPHSELGVGIACLRGEVQGAREIHAEQHLEINRLRREIDYLSAAKAEQSLELGRMRHVLDSRSSVDVSAVDVDLEEAHLLSSHIAPHTLVPHVLLSPFLCHQIMQLEDYTIRALQVELKAGSRRGIAGPDAKLVNAPDQYTGCRQFFQSGFCHFGRGRRPCPNENTHFCTECGRGHGTAPHRIMLRRLSDRTLNAGLN